MHRLRDYVGFVVWFAGLGYMAIWPLSASGTSGALFGASVLCHAPAPFGVLGVLCRAPHPLTLSPASHVLGFLLAVAAALRLAYRALRRAWRARAGGTNAARAIRISAALMPSNCRHGRRGGSSSIRSGRRSDGRRLRSFRRASGPLRRMA